MTDLVLSASLDWTIKLWNPKLRSSALYSFESSQEYIYDVQWSPKHPGVFASVDYGGYVNVWNINQNKEQPVVRGQPNEKDPKPLNCLKFA
jgi:dynein intermediate chain